MRSSRGALKITSGDTAFDQFAVVEHEDFVGHFARESHLVRHDDLRHALVVELSA